MNLASRAPIEAAAISSLGNERAFREARCDLAMKDCLNIFIIGNKMQTINCSVCSIAGSS